MIIDSVLVTRKDIYECLCFLKLPLLLILLLLVLNAKTIELLKTEIQNERARNADKDQRIAKLEQVKLSKHQVSLKQRNFS